MGQETILSRDSSMNNENSFVRRATCDALHSGLATSIAEMKSDIKDIKNAMNPMLLKHSEWIDKHDEQLRQRREISWRLWILILSPTATLLIQIIYNLAKRLS